MDPMGYVLFHIMFPFKPSHVEYDINKSTCHVLFGAPSQNDGRKYYKVRIPAEAWVGDGAWRFWEGDVCRKP
jgi:hypothetical protein